MSKLDLKFLPKDHGLSINNEIGSISLRCTRLQPQQDFGVVTTHLRLETDITEIHVCFYVIYRKYKFFFFSFGHFNTIIFYRKTGSKVFSMTDCFSSS